MVGCWRKNEHPPMKRTPEGEDETGGESMKRRQVEVHSLGEEEQVQVSDVELEQVQGARQEEGQVQVCDVEREQGAHQEEEKFKVSLEVGGGGEEAGSVSVWSPGPGWKSMQARGLGKDSVAKKYETVQKSTYEDMSMACLSRAVGRRGLLALSLAGRLSRL